MRMFWLLLSLANVLVISLLGGTLVIFAMYHLWMGVIFNLIWLVYWTVSMYSDLELQHRRGRLDGMHEEALRRVNWKFGDDERTSETDEPSA